MSQSEKHKFEEEWQQAFESAAETPPPSAWEGIEARLDARKSAVVVPLAWWRSPKVLYAAAAVAALLLLSWPALRFSQRDNSGEVASEIANSSIEPSATDAPELADRVPEASPSLRPKAAPGTNPPTRPAVVTPEAEPSADAPAVALAPPSNPSAEVPERLESIAIESQKMRSVSANSSALATLPRVSVPEPEPMSLAEATDRKSSKSNRLLSAFGEMKKGAPTNGFMPNSSAPTSQTPTIIAITSSNRHGKPEDVERVIMGSSTVPLRTPASTFPVARLSPVGTAEGAVNLATPAVRYDEAAMPTLPRRGRVREFWAGLSLMPAIFNPKIDVTTAPAVFTNAKASRESMSSGSRGRLSYAIQLQGGKQLSRHWSVETGVSFLQGNSDFNSPGYVLDATTSQSQNVLENALVSANRQLGNYSSFNGAVFLDQTNVAYIDLEQNTRNDYRYVQVPVQAGYTLNPGGRLSYTLLGGVIANLFVQNQLQDSQGATLKTTAEDGVYRELNWSATTGVRLNYRLAEHWDATLTGTYQKALASILRDSPTLDSRPQLYGAAWGVRYVF